MVSKDTLIDYLLHQMPETERLDFAEKWFSDPELCEQLETAEAELLDAYVRAGLPRKQRDLVERYLLNSDGQRRKLDLAAALHATIKARPSRPKFFSLPWIGIYAAAIFLVALLATGGMIFRLIQKNQQLGLEIAQLGNDVKQPAGGVYSTALTSSLRGSSAGRPLVLPKDILMVRLDLELGDGEDRQVYSASLSKAGAVAWKEEPLHKETRGAASLVSFWIPAHVLQAGNYTVALESAGTPVAYYSLAVQPDHRAP